MYLSGPEPTERQLVRTTRPVLVNGAPGVVSILPDNSFAIHLDSRFLSLPRRPVGRFNPELLGVLRVQSPPAELHRLGADHASDGSSAEKVIQNIETNVPSGSAHCDEAGTDVGPQRQART